MALQKLDNSNISKHLGQTSQYKSTYDPELLVREPRQSNRTHLGLEDDNLPFVGGDTWNAYEVSGLTNKGLPVCGVGKIYYPCDGKYIVESKSIKLYFNSFNMTKLGETADDVRKEIAKRASADLSELLEVKVDVKIFSNAEMLAAAKFPILEYYHTVDGFITLEDVYPIEDIEFSVYQETPELLEVVENPIPDLTTCYHSALLKSNSVLLLSQTGVMYILSSKVRRLLILSPFLSILFPSVMSVTSTKRFVKLLLSVLSMFLTQKS